MTHIPLLGDLALIAAIAVVVTGLLHRLRLPTVAGLLAAGAIVGPFGLGLIRNVENIEVLAEVGVVLLLFTIGLEFSLGRLRHIFRSVALGGALQVGGTVAATAGLALLMGASPPRAIFYGFVFCMSSTAIVLRALSDRGELDAPHGRFIVGTLIFQDLCVIPMILLVPLLGGGESPAGAAWGILLALAKAVAVVAGALFLARGLIPRALRMVDASRSREVFLLAVLATCVGTAWATSLVGLSLALGAFLGGMVVADTEFQHRAMGEILPLRDAFVSLFFISLGMLFDGRTLVRRPGEVVLLLFMFIAAKAALASLAALAMGFPARAAWLAGIGLGQFGEFGFVLLRLGEPSGLAAGEHSEALLAAGLISMFLTPILIRTAPHLTAGERLLGPLARLMGVKTIDQDEAAESLSGHVVVIGYGVAGKLVRRALRDVGLPHLVLEMNAETVRAARAESEPVYYADATSTEALQHAGVPSARAVAVLINDPQGALRVLDTARRLAPGVPVLIRTRYVPERQQLLDLGAADVVVEEVEASVEVLGRLLRRLEVPRNLIDAQIRQLRVDTKTPGRQPKIPRGTLCDQEALAGLKIESVALAEGTHGAGRTVGQLDVGKKTGAQVLAIRREGGLIEAPGPNTPLLAGDIVYLAGDGDAVRKALHLLEGTSEGMIPGP